MVDLPFVPVIPTNFEVLFDLASKSISQMDLLGAIASDCGKNIPETNVDQT